MEPRRSVSVFPFVEGPPRLVLLVLRTPERAAGWQPVTGRVEAGDPSLADAAVREIGEETGLPPPAETIDLGLETAFTGYDGARYHQRAFAARYADAAPPRRSEEHEAARWVRVAEARAILRWEEDKTALDALVSLLRGRPRSRL